MATAYHNLSEYDFNSVPDASNMKFASLCPSGTITSPAPSYKEP